MKFSKGKWGDVMIPKIIHYCWFGNNTLPEKALRCIESWRKYCPNYEIKCWDETNFDCECCDYVREAYKEKKWAFVSDFARFKILYDYGGLYFDTDVEIIRPLNELVAKGPFMGCEQEKDDISINPGLGLAANSRMDVYKKILEHYEKEKFLRNDGTYDSKTVCARVTEILSKDGFKGNREIEFIDGIYIYPPEFFAPKNFLDGKIKLTENTVSIHHYDATWYEPEEKISYKIEQKLNRIFGKRIGMFVNLPIHYFYRFKLRSRQKGGFFKAISYFKTKTQSNIKRGISKRRND